MDHYVELGIHTGDFSATAVMPDGTVDEIHAENRAEDQYLVLFFYPADFTFV